MKAAVADSAFYRYMSLRSSSLSAQQQTALMESLGAKLPKISSTTGAIKTGGMAASLLAMRNLSDDISEDFGGDE